VAHGLPVHAQMLRYAAQNIQKGGAEFSYTLRSLWPINAGHGPQNPSGATRFGRGGGSSGDQLYTEEPWAADATSPRSILIAPPCLRASSVTTNIPAVPVATSSSTTPWALS